MGEQSPITLSTKLTGGDHNMAGKLKRDLTGQFFGKLLVLSRAKNDRHNNVCWHCRCECGKETIVRSGALLQKHTTSCGCYGREQLRLGRLKHGLSKHPLYQVYHNMLQRCYNENNPNFPDYGERGIKVHVSWQNDPQKFIEWGLVNGWKKNFQLDRVDNDGNYTPDNCRFVSHRENMSNTRIQKNRDLPVGVRLYRNRFTAYINLGSFITSEEAHFAYLKAVERLNLV